MAIVVDWNDGDEFTARTPTGIELPVDGTREVGVSPIESVLVALGACMGLDIVDILGKGRQHVTGCTLTLDGDRPQKPPRRYTAIRLSIRVEGHDLDRARVERAVELRRSTYCSVWSTLAPDIDYSIDLDVQPAG